MTASVPLRGEAAILARKMSAMRLQLGRKVARRVGAAAAIALLLASCTASQPALQDIRARGELRVVMLNAPTSYYLGAHGPQGFEYRLVSAFAQQLGVKLTVQAVADTAAVRAALRHGHADMAAAQISADGRWLNIGEATEPYEDLTQLVVQGRGKARPRDVTSLQGAHMVVLANSPQLAMLRSIQSNGVPGLSWREVPADQVDLLKLVTEGEADYAVMDANEFEFTQHLYPDASIAFKLPDTRPVQWIVRQGGDDLVQAANRFFAGAKASGDLARIAQDASAEAVGFDYTDARRFQSDVADRLPELRALFDQAAQDTGLDWRLIAAVGYQESRWQMQAVSGDGARGIMMLTSDAASMVGVSDRTDQSQNILGGAKYLAQAFASIPKRIAEPDRTWFALAAYNTGYGHVEDARVLAQMRGKNPDSWTEVREQLPLLAEEAWYSKLKRGYARGWEPARFVDQVRQYLAVLEWSDADANSVAQMHIASAEPMQTLN
jgi:membrane-bound lytic murein transglycosylase F